MSGLLSLKARLACIFILLGVLCIGVAAVGIEGIQNGNARAQRTYDTLTRPAQAIESSYIITTTEAIQLLEGLASSDESTKQQRLDFIEQLQKDSDSQFVDFQNSPKDGSIKDVSSRIEQDHAKFSEVFLRAVELFREGKTTEALSVEGGELRPYGIALFKDMAQISTLLRDQAKAANERDIAAYRRMMAIMTMILLVGGLTAGSYAWAQLRAVGSSIGGIQRALQEVSESMDLTRRAPVERMDEIGQTAQAFNHLMDRVMDVMTTVYGAVESVAAASREIALGNADLSSRTEQQAASLEETSANMEELAGTVQQNAGNAREAAMLAAKASDTARRGNEVVSEAVDTMREISSSSAKIADITGMIEGIAFQTNILALNAAVEAARAGEQGRGFAVVAGEVRSLAQRAARAAKEIKDLIVDSVERVEAGSKQVHEAGNTIREIVGSATKVTDLVHEIATASEEQNQGINQVGHAVAQMDEVTQQNAALVEQAAAAAQSLEDQASSLREAVDVFKLGARAMAHASH
ncbi:methyl-accepting chemotaxis protein [Paraburkholderia fungorum]|uniref:methyl-accepting chemotaxis protein n=1 Tax=Paraburkholderia fungorum TaxID=134537 RepID=UPI0004062A69|nr:methyl-accepting chemotaxis protein [Paraburkholderia fungorum]PZR48466.1 MAG: methyl-accepting chemotaxis protein [Paraburkholderia fungorum]